MFMHLFGLFTSFSAVAFVLRGFIQLHHPAALRNRSKHRAHVGIYLVFSPPVCKTQRRGSPSPCGAISPAAHSAGVRWSMWMGSGQGDERRGVELPSVNVGEREKDSGGRLLCIKDMWEAVMEPDSALCVPPSHARRRKMISALMKAAECLFAAVCSE